MRGTCFFLLSGLVLSYAVIITRFEHCSEGDPYGCAPLMIDHPTPASTFVQTYMGTVYWCNKEKGDYLYRVVGNAVITQPYLIDPKFVVILGDSNLYTVQSDPSNLISFPLPPTFPMEFFSSAHLHPFQVGWLLVVYCDDACSIIYTTNFGESWSIVAENMLASDTTVFWSPSSTLPDTIFATLLDSSVGYFYNFSMSTWTTLFPSTLGFSHTEDYLFVEVLNGTKFDLYASSKHTDSTWTQKSNFIKADFSYNFENDATDIKYLTNIPIWDSFNYIPVRSINTEFVAVKTSDSGATLFSSDFNSKSFEFSLDQLAIAAGSHPEYGLIAYDFYALSGLDGIFIANSYPDSNHTFDVRQTKITYDSGGEWRLLPAPVNDLTGAPTNCFISNGCSLHLLAPSYLSSFDFFYDHPPDPIGLIVSVGNTGTSLGTYGQTYISRDAGLTWNIIWNEPMLHAFSKSGDVLVLASSWWFSDSIMYSLDQGATMSTVKFTSSYIVIKYIIPVPSAGSSPIPQGDSTTSYGPTPTDSPIKEDKPAFWMFGYDQDNYWQWWIIDFSDLSLPNCTAADYEIFSPSNGEPGKKHCFMGEATDYLRRKATSECFSTSQVLNHTACPCTWEDYECDTGFYPGNRNAKNEFNCTSILKNLSASDCATRYRLVPDTHCTLKGGLDLNSNNCESGLITTGATTSNTGTPQASTGGGHPTSTGLQVGISIVVIFGAIVVVVALLYKKNTVFHNFIHKHLFERTQHNRSKFAELDSS